MEGPSTSSNLELIENAVGRGELPIVLHTQCQQDPEDELPILLRLRQECERTEHDESELWVENTRLKEDLKKMKQQERKMLQEEKLIQNQLSFSEQERYSLELEVAKATDECCTKAKLLDETSEELRLVKLELDSMVLAAQNEKQIQVKLPSANEGTAMSSSSQDLQLENLALRTLVEAQETMIAGLTGTIRGLSSLDKPLGGHKLSNKRNLMLSEELVDRDNHSLPAGAQETKINPRSAKHASQELEMILRDMEFCER
ncbi:hypothetical protein PtA15_15A134 [Puccinia triticina]|uniref:Pericentrin/AKAP-450 centrosomal targeting domain-containing protein n=1 Tax=Puccinia triticina TaxID=208348 RepID=A0ABY7D3P0_9BASI|nr:uncharacterized protein PtA15_15A134 [Puccinia triticina]WAQ91743.1 hypothetical protein PtA15_15A134 [Puccinia triticina]